LLAASLPSGKATVKPLLDIAYSHRGRCQIIIPPVRHDIAKQFGQRIRKTRLERNLSQESLAAKANLDRAFLSGIERGVENPSLFTIQAIADGLEISIGKLMKGI